MPPKVSSKDHRDDVILEDLHQHDARLWNLLQDITRNSTVLETLSTRVETLTDTLSDIQEHYRDIDNRFDRKAEDIEALEERMAKDQETIALLNETSIKLNQGNKYMKKIIAFESIILGILLLLIGIASVENLPIIVDFIKALLL